MFVFSVLSSIATSLHSLYPEQRKVVDLKDGMERGVTGKLECVATSKPTTQPISSFDWSRDKNGLFAFGSFDQMLRVGIATRLDSL